MAASSMGLPAGSVKSSLMVIVAVEGVPKAAPDVAFDRVRVKVSGPSTKLSCEISKGIVLVVSPATNISVPNASVKSHFAEAFPFGVEHGTADAPPSDVA